MLVSPFGAVEWNIKCQVEGASEFLVRNVYVISTLSARKATLYVS